MAILRGRFHPRPVQKQDSGARVGRCYAFAADLSAAGDGVSSPWSSTSKASGWSCRPGPRRERRCGGARGEAGAGCGSEWGGGLEVRANTYGVRFLFPSTLSRIRGDLAVRVPRRSARARASVRRWPWSSRRGRNGGNRPLYALNWTRLSCHRFAANRVRCLCSSRGDISEIRRSWETTPATPPTSSPSRGSGTG